MKRIDFYVDESDMEKLRNKAVLESLDTGEQITVAQLIRRGIRLVIGEKEAEDQPFDLDQG